MKKRSGCLNRLLSAVILAGILAAAALFALGYHKAEEAEAAAPVSGLYDSYVGDNSKGFHFDAGIVNTLIDSAVDKDSFYGRCLHLFGDHTVANLLVKKIYLSDDGLISTTIAQAILTYRVEKAYDDNETLLIYCYAMGYGPGDLNSVENLVDKSGVASLKDLVNIDSSFVNDILGYLTEHGYLSEENGAAIKDHLTTK